MNAMQIHQFFADQIPFLSKFHLSGHNCGGTSMHIKCITFVDICGKKPNTLPTFKEINRKNWGKYLDKSLSYRLSFSVKP